MTVLLVLLLLFALLLMGVPVAFSIGAASVVGLWAIGGFDTVLALFETVPYTNASHVSLVAVPLYLLMAHFIVISTIGADLFAAIRLLLGRVPASLGIATVGGGAMFGAMSGSTIASASVFGKSAFSPLVAAGYSPRLAGGVISVAGTLAVMIPPSLTLIFYAFMAEVSAGSMLIAGIVPGALGALAIVAVLLVMAWRRPDQVPAGQRYSLRAKLGGLKIALPLLLLFGVITVSLYTGWATVNESAAVGAIGAALLGIARRRLTLKQVGEALIGSVATTTMVVTIVIFAYMFGYFLAMSRVTPRLASWVGDLGIPVTLIMLAICLFYMLMGTFMDEAALMFLSVPVLVPVVSALEVDLIWFGVMIVLMQQIGLLSPPLGLTVFVVARVTGRPTGEVFVGVLPFVLALAALGALFFVFPGIVTWLPDLMRS